ncbi:MAG TPA: M48 family metalloprotease [Myxococcota bacterium]|nr:M48 family metalloprotease [Myxococcota bacterium]HRY93007.1 M48 family metalloprotease [Myxococcota bacterium]HSA20260.1 M48 family metalloprotease [Myxococcota bacterium]
MSWQTLLIAAAQPPPAGWADEQPEPLSLLERTGALDVALISAAVLFGTLVLVFGLGFLLSRSQLRRMQAQGAGRPGSVRTGQEKLVDTLHDGVLWISVVSFYLGFPFLLALSGIIAYEIISLASSTLQSLLSNLHVVPLRLLIPFALITLVAALSLVVLLAGFFVKSDRSGRGRELRREDEPALFAAVASVAERVGARMVDRIELHLDGNFAVQETGSTLGVLFGRGQRILHLGLTGLLGESETHLRSVLAHEFGHFSHGETRMSTILAGVIMRLGSTCRNYQNMGALGALHPAAWYSGIYLWIFRRLVAGISRRRELLADRAAAAAYGGKLFAESLEAIGRDLTVYYKYFLPAAHAMRRAGLSVTHALSLMGAIERGLLENGWVPSQEETGPSEPDPTRSHPDDAERIAAVAHVGGEEAASQRPWLELLAAPNRLAAELTATLVEGLDAMLSDDDQLPGQTTQLAPAEEEAVAAALGVCFEAADRFERSPGEENLARMARAVASLERAPRHEPFLVDQLHGLARAQSRAGHHADADACIVRALALLAGRPGLDLARLDLESFRRSLQDDLARLAREQTDEAGVVALTPAPGPPAATGAPAPAPGKGRLCPYCGCSCTQDELVDPDVCPWCGSMGLVVR